MNIAATLSTLPGSSKQSCPSPLISRFWAVRAATLALIEPLSPEDLMVQSSPDTSPVKWHLAHTSWFFETFVLRDFLPGYRDFHPDFHWLFNSYYNTLGDMPAKSLRASFSRPPLDAILGYRTHVDVAIARLLAIPASDCPDSDEVARRIALGLEHEQQHQELIATDIKHALFTNPLHPAYRDASTAPETRFTQETIAPPLGWITFNPGLTQIGFAPDPNSGDPAEAFCFDNETPRHSVFLSAFSLATRLVTCAEYLAFLDDNGYTRPELWLAEGWSAMRKEGWQAPLYWQRHAAARSGWRIYTLHGWQALEDLSETPVCHISLFEADAYARWASLAVPGTRLPTEFEWEYAAAQLGTFVQGDQAIPRLLISSQTDGSSTAFAGTPANLVEVANFHTTSARDLPGLQQIFGDVWEWTSSGYTGYPGYHPLPGALGEYNGKFMSSQVILRGGSCVTPATHIRATYRNFFPPSTRWQFSGVRLAKDASAGDSAT